jgi:hypothetical protein
LQEILLNVDSEGMWEYDESVCLAYVSGNKLQELKIKLAADKEEEQLDVLMTALCLAVLNVYHANDKSKWNLIAKKS